MSNVIIAIDPGNQGGITIINEDKPLIYKIPIAKIKTNNKVRSEYDMISIRDLFSKYKKNVFVFSEKVSARTGEGPVGAFSFGKSLGRIEGLCIGLGFNYSEISSQSWKKHFPNLTNSDIQKLKDELSNNRKKSQNLKKQKLINDKTLKDMRKNKDKYKLDIDKVKKENLDINAAVKSIKNDNRKLNNRVKTIAKSNARAEAVRLYPEFKDLLKFKNSDGVAESLLIAIYCKDILIDKLV